MTITPWLLATPEEQDAARRLADAVNAHVTIARETRQDRTSPPFIGISLDTGACVDNVLYDTREDCVRHLVRKDPYVFPIRVGVDDMSVTEAWVVLSYARQAKANGTAFHHEDPIVPQRIELLTPYVPRARILLPGGNRAQRRARR